MHLIELVPRSLNSFQNEVAELLKRFPELYGVNIPDINQLPIRSHDAAEYILDLQTHVIPHIRAIDRTLKGTISIVSRLMEKGLNAILVISGDVPSSPKKLFDIGTLDVISALRKEFPDLKIYAGVDQYRNSFEQELSYCKEKLDVGANGFFTQPFFDVDLSKKYLHHFMDIPFYLGISPVITDASKHYWETKNNVVFPQQYKFALDYNVRLARELIELADSVGQHTYLMPIKMDVIEYLDHVFRK